MQNQFKIERFSSQKKIERKKKIKVRVKKMNLLDVALREIELVWSPKISLKLKDFPQKKKKNKS